MGWDPLADVQAFFDGESRMQTALVGGLAGGVAGAVGSAVDVPLLQRVVVVAGVALVLALGLALVLGHRHRRGA